MLGEAERVKDDAKCASVIYPFGKDAIASYTFKYRSLSRSIINVVLDIAETSLLTVPR
jgi:hypothetical protein